MIWINCEVLNESLWGQMVKSPHHHSKEWTPRRSYANGKLNTAVYSGFSCWQSKKTFAMFDYNKMVASMVILVNAKRQNALSACWSSEIPSLCKLKELICEASSFWSILPYTAMYKDVFQDTGTSFSIRMCSMYDFDVVVQLLEEWNTEVALQSKWCQ